MRAARPEPERPLPWRPRARVGEVAVGAQVEVYDVSDVSAPSALVRKGAYDEATSPAVHLQAFGDHALVRARDGFTIYQVVPVP